MNINDSYAPRPWYKEPWLWLILAPLILVVCASMVTVSIAFHSADDVVKGDYYRDGRGIYQNNAPEKTARALNIQSDVQFDWDAGVLSVTLNHQREGETMLLDLIHPARASNDYSFALEERVPGVYVTTLEKPDGDAWYLRLIGSLEGAEQWRLTGHVNFNESLRVHLK